MRTARNTLMALLAVALPALALALDAPHDKSFLPGNCQECHQLHNALGASLTTQVTISDACMACHGTHPNARLGFPWSTTDQAVRKLSGVHHRWDATAVQNAAFGDVGTVLPSDPEMAKRILAGKLECSVCHNQHQANKGFAPTSSIHSSFEVGTAYPETNAASAGTATLTIQSLNLAAAEMRGYRLRYLTATNVALSHDGGLTWFRPTTTAGAPWVADAATPVGGPLSTTGNITMDDPAMVIRLAAGAVAGDYWDFYVSSPMLRTANQTGTLCLGCHVDRAQGHVSVESGGDGLKVFSHPIGERLNTNGKGYDRAIPLDVDGGEQGVNGDTNATNNYELGSGDTVTCNSCHAPHNADSNSMTVDPR